MRAELKPAGGITKTKRGDGEWGVGDSVLDVCSPANDQDVRTDDVPFIRRVRAVLDNVRTRLSNLEKVDHVDF